MKSAVPLLLFASACALAGTARAQDQTFLYFNSQPGDSIGQGQEFTLTPANGTLTTTGTSDGVYGVSVAFDDGVTPWPWRLSFEPPFGAILTAGMYDGAMLDVVSPPTVPRLAVIGAGRACTTYTGRFVVLEVEYGPGDDVVRFAADYEQHCDGASAALFGSVRINSSVTYAPRLSVGASSVKEGNVGTASLPIVVSLSAPAATPVTVDYATADGTAIAGSDYDATSGTASFAPGVTAVVVNVPVHGDAAVEGDERVTMALSNPVGAPIAFSASQGTILNDDLYEGLLYINSQPGDYVGQGQEFTVTQADGPITSERCVGDGRVLLTFGGATKWQLFFAPPGWGNELKPGVYEGAARYPLEPGPKPGLSVSGGGRACDMLTGRFTVLEAAYQVFPPEPEFPPPGCTEVVRFAVDFEQHCEGDSAALFGSARINSSVPLGPRLSVSGASVYEGDVGLAHLRFVVSLSAPATVPVSVDYATADGTATAGTDYDAVSATASFAVGVASVVVDVPVHGDTETEGNESLTMSLSNAMGAPIAFGVSHGGILDDDPYKTLLYFNSQPGDPVGGGQELTLTPADGMLVAHHTDSGIGVRFDDQTTQSWGLSFKAPFGANLPPGIYEGATGAPDHWPFPGLVVGAQGRPCSTRTGRFTVWEATYGDYGQVEQLAVDYEQHCDGASPALFGSVRFHSSVPFGPASVPAPGLGVSARPVYEGDVGPTSMRFVVSLSAPALVPVTVDYTTADGTATAGSDYDATSGTASFAAGVTSVEVDVPVHGDTAIEGDETLTMSLSNATGAAVAFGVGQGTILNDDPYKTSLYFNSQPGDPVGEGQKVTLTMTDGRIGVDRWSGGVHVVFKGGTAWDLLFTPPFGANLTPGVYEGATGRVYYSPVPGLSVDRDGHGCNTVTGRFVVLEAEYGPGGEVLRFAVDYEQHCDGASAALFGSVRINSSVGFGSAVGPRLSVSAGSAYEGDVSTTNLRFVVSLSAPAAAPVTVDFATADGTATAGSDYVSTAGTASFAEGVTSVEVDVPVEGDREIELDETLTMSLSNAMGAAVAFGVGQGTILNDDPYKTLLGFYTLPPCRLLDTRMTGPALEANTVRSIGVLGLCGLPMTAKALALNVTSVSPTDFGDVRLYPAGTTATTSVLNFGRGQTRASNAIVALGEEGAIAARCDMPAGSATHLVVDVFGYFQ